MAASPYRIRPSSFPRVLACPGSLQMEEKFPEVEDSESAREGTAAHECFAMELDGVPYKVGDTASNGVIIDAEMLEAGDEFADRLRSWGTPYTYIEQQMPCASIHPLCGGTPDAWSWDAAALLIRVADMKYGHRDVEVFEHPQLAAYTSGIADLLQINGLQEQHIAVEWSIYQPRSYRSGGPWKVWKFLLSDLRALHNKMRAAAIESVGPSPRCIPSAQCRDCLGRHSCVALQHASASITDFVGETIEIFTLNETQCAGELRRLNKAMEVLQSRIEGLEEQATAAIRAGRRVPGYELQQSYGREQWRPEKLANVGTMAQLLNINVYKERELITPNQARKLGLLVDDLDLSVKPAGKFKLVPVNTTQTAKIFGDK